MQKKITIVGIIGVVIIVSLILSLSNVPDDEVNDVTMEPDMNIEPDVIMPTKVSRPGCEENNLCYIPSQITIKKGNSVIWINEDSAFHSVTSGFYDDPSGLFDSGYLDPFQSFSFVFEETGVYDYYCTLHPWMYGKVIVE
ncbi:MAG: cupredoxin domain-containing protein [Nitrosopumilus sp.]